MPQGLAPQVGVHNFPGLAFSEFLQAYGLKRAGQTEVFLDEGDGNASLQKFDAPCVAENSRASQFFFEAAGLGRLIEVLAYVTGVNMRDGAVEFRECGIFDNGQHPVHGLFFYLHVPVSGHVDSRRGKDKVTVVVDVQGFAEAEPSMADEKIDHVEAQSDASLFGSARFGRPPLPEGVQG